MIGSATILTGTVSQVVLTLWGDIPGMTRCQEWTSEFIDDMVKQGLLSESVLDSRGMRCYKSCSCGAAGGLRSLFYVPL